MLDWYKARATHHKRLGLLWKTVLTLAQLTAITMLVGQLAGYPTVAGFVNIACMSQYWRHQLQ